MDIKFNEKYIQELRQKSIKRLRDNNINDKDILVDRAIKFKRFDDLEDFANGTEAISGGIVCLMLFDD